MSCSQCSPQHTKSMSAVQDFSADYSLVWEWESKRFDVATGRYGNYFNNHSDFTSNIAHKSGGAISSETVLRHCIVTNSKTLLMNMVEY